MPRRDDGRIRSVQTLVVLVHSFPMIAFTVDCEDSWHWSFLGERGGIIVEMFTDAVLCHLNKYSSGKARREVEERDTHRVQRERARERGRRNVQHFTVSASITLGHRAKEGRIESGGRLALSSSCVLLSQHRRLWLGKRENQCNLDCRSSMRPYSGMKKKCLTRTQIPDKCSNSTVGALSSHPATFDLEGHFSTHASSSLPLSVSWESQWLLFCLLFSLSLCFAILFSSSSPLPLLLSLCGCWFNSVKHMQSHTRFSLLLLCVSVFAWREWKRRRVYSGKQEEWKERHKDTQSMTAEEK